MRLEGCKPASAQMISRYLRFVALANHAIALALLVRRKFTLAGFACQWHTEEQLITGGAHSYYHTTLAVGTGRWHDNQYMRVLRLLSCDRRLSARFALLVKSHLQATQNLASGIHAIPDAKEAFAATIAAHRFLNNRRLSMPALAEPLLHAARTEVPEACDRFGLVAHDWSQINYANHATKKDRLALSSSHQPEGYELQSALLLSDRDGSPLAPLVVSLRTADGVHCSRVMMVRPALSPLDELDPAMTFMENQNLGRPLVHIIDAEADSVWHYRQWSERPGRLFVVRSDDRIVEYDGQKQRASAIRESLRRQGAFRRSRAVLYHGHEATQYAAEVSIWLVRPAQRNRPATNDRRHIPGKPLNLRLVISEVRDSDGNVLAVWYLLSNVPAEVDAATIALWYYWRWSIESYFKLLKSAGMNVESWEQEEATAIARRLLVASMACVTVWRLRAARTPRPNRLGNSSCV